MLLARSVFVVIVGAYVAAPTDPLRVMRAAPQDVADQNAVVMITFDRPIAAGVESAVDPQTILRIEPRVNGQLDWRDPVTLRFRPAVALPVGRTFTVTIANTFQALDGSRLEQPYTLTFRVQGPRVADAWPVNQWMNPKHITLDARFLLLVESPVDLRLVESLVTIDAGACGASSIRVRAERQRRIVERDPRWGWYRRVGADTLADLKRVVELVPVQPLPRDCAARLGVPERVDAGATPRWWNFRTYGPPGVGTVSCGFGGRGRCPIGPVVVDFATPVRGAEVLAHVRVVPAVPLSVRDTGDESDRWVLDGELKPRTRYQVVIDSALTDVFRQRLGTRVVKDVATTPFTPTVRYPYGRMVVERNGLRTIAVQHVNIDTLDLIVAGVPDSLEGQALARSWGWEDLWSRLLPAATRQRIPVTGTPDVPRVTAVRLPASNPARPGNATLLAVKVASGQSDPDDSFKPVALVQITDLAINARIGTEEGVVWVTGVADGKARSGATVTLYDPKGRQRATAVTDSRGLARLTGFAPPDTTAAPPSNEDCEYCGGGGGDGFEGYVAVKLGVDRALVGINQYDPDLSPWQFNVTSAWGEQRRLSAATVFTERGIYRPGEPVYAKAIVRRGPLGTLAVPRGDSLRWKFLGREDAVLKDTTVALSAFGTSAVTFPLGPDLPLGEYRVVVHTKRDGRWGRAADTWYRIAEYRPPEFLVSVAADKAPHFAGDALAATVEARYLFGAPMARASVSWFARQRTAWWWDFEIPNTDGFTLGETGWWWEENESGSGNASGQVLQSGADTLDGAGRLRLTLVAPAPTKGRPAWTTFEATVTDVNRQNVGASASVLVHPAAFYVGAKVEGNEYFWQAAKARTVGVIAVTPEGRRVPGVSIRGTLIRREWHQVRRTREGYAEDVGEWVADTVARCAVTTGAQPAPCTVTPPAGGSYTMRFTATDPAGRPAVTSFHRWVVGTDWVPWNDDSKFKMDVVPDKTRYTVGDTATVLFASPFTNAEAWITVEREGVIDQRRLRLTSGTTTLRLPITEAYAPNAFVSIIVVRGRSAPPAAPDDPGRPTLRVGYAELRVTPEVKRLKVDVQPVQAEYRPGDTARVRLQVRDARGIGRRAEVTLWAVDEGVLALTGYKTPDPVDLLYKRRGLGLRLASTLVAVAAQVVEGEKGQRAPGGGGGMDVEGILRSRFQTTAFFLGSVVTDSAGRAVAAAKLPDNLTTFRVMAVAVTAGDRYGSGESPLLVTRPLLARPALPRFVREDDRFNAGVVVNQRLGGTPRVLVEARSTGVTLVDSAAKTVTLEAGRGREVRFAFRGVPGDSATYRFKVSSGTEADAVETRVPVRPAFHARAFAAAGVLTDTASVEFTFPEALDPARSRVELSFGTSTLAIVRGYQRTLEIYPYYCSEQIASVALPLIALYQAEKQLGGAPVLRGDPRRQIDDAVAILSRRQRDDGAIGLWSSRDWSNAWLSAHAGRALLAARTAGIAVNDSVLTRLAGYLTRYLRSEPAVFIPVAYWYDDPRVRLSDRLAAADFLSRLGRPDVATENSLLGLSAQLAWEDRVLLAEIVARRRQLDAARALLEPTWRQVKVEGRRATLPDEANRRFYFYSSVRGAARLLSATLAVDPSHPLVGPLVETVVQRGRVAAQDWWNTQDYGAAVQALLAFERRRRQSGPRPVRLMQGGRTLLQATARGSFADTSLALSGLLENRPDGKQGLRLGLDAAAAGDPVFFYVTVREVPRTKPVTPFDQGIRVERWYERYDTGSPVTSVAEGELVRVRLRITVPAQRSFLVVDDALPAGLEAVDLSLRTQGALPPSDKPVEGEQEEEQPHGWMYGYWEYGWWSPFDYRELRDDRVVYVATTLWPGTYTATYVARATTPGVFIRPPAHAEEMYNPAVNGRSDGGVFTVTARP
jgi:uncharacterized protein YfaS (alpha-2-macroglobulin family)